MLLGDYEFRGYEEKVSSKGNKYINLFMEDCENGQSVRFYVSANNPDNYNCIANLEKGSIHTIKMNYHQGYGGNYQADFVGFVEE